jgi:hypothetical protein
MKNLYAILFCLTFCAAMSFGQSTAFDWTRKNCQDNIEHNLFAELDSGYCVVLDFVMIPYCYGCIFGAAHMQEMLYGYSQTHPGKVRWYLIGFDDGYTCSQLITWSAKNRFFPDGVFTTGAKEVAYYGGMGMPTLAVVGRRDHKVFYTKFGFAPSDTIRIKKAIDEVLSTTSDIYETTLQPEVPTLFPNPAAGELTLAWPALMPPIHSLQFIDLMGRRIPGANAEPVSPTSLHILVDYLSPGFYYLKIETSDGSSHLLKFMRL